MLAVTFNFSRYFNPLPPRGGRLPSRFCKICSSDFNPLPPRGGRPFSAEVKSLGLTISIHSLRVEGDNARGRERPWRVHISIHSLRVEGDRQRIQRRNRFINFNPLPPRGGRPLRLKPFARLRTFQSTPSAWRETWSELQSAKYPELFQSTPSAWRETVARISILRLRTYFNPLPPRGGRPTERANDLTEQIFQSTPSAWRETLGLYHYALVTLYFNPLPPRGGRPLRNFVREIQLIFQSTPSAWRET